jgi:hypothetical protein
VAVAVAVTMTSDFKGEGERYSLEKWIRGSGMIGRITGKKLSGIGAELSELGTNEPSLAKIESGSGAVAVKKKKKKKKASSFLYVHFD